MSVLGQFVGKCCDANVVNNNDMHLGEKLFKNLFESEDYKRAMKNRHYIGFLGHPENIDCQDYKDACIVMTDCQILANGEVEGTFDLLDTKVGNIVKTFIDAGVKFGISIRGAGDVDGNGEVDPDTFIFRGFDLVTFPAYDDCIPEFKAVAASTDAKKQKKYKKVCAAVMSELKNITSTSALEVIKEQFNEGTDEYNAVNDRIEELASTPEEPVIFDKSDDEIAQEVLEEKVDALTNLYVDAQQTIAQLEEDLVAAAHDREDELVAAKTQLKHYKRIVANQLKDAQESYEQEVLANDQLKSELHDVKGRLVKAHQQIKAAQQSNLKYQRKIEANSSVLTEKDSAIEDIKNQLHETVVAKSQLESRLRDVTNDRNELKSRIESTENILLQYQQAYANLYAGALGRHVSNLTVDSATSVKDLQNMICSSTNTSGMMAAPNFDTEILEEDDFNEDEIEGQDDELSGYSADLVTM